MVSPDIIEEDYEAMEEDSKDPGTIINEKPVGTGYFKFDEWEPGEHIRLVNNEDYWDEPALLDSVVFKVVKEDLTRVAEIERSEEHTSELQSRGHLVCRLLLEKKNQNI